MKVCDNTTANIDQFVHEEPDIKCLLYFNEQILKIEIFINIEKIMMED